MRGVEDADWLHLTDDEEVRWAGRPSRYTIAIQLAVAATAAAVGAGLILFVWEPTLLVTIAATVVGAVLLLAGLGYGAYVYLKWRRLLYVITTEEVYVKEGLISRDVVQIRLDRIQNTTYEQSILQRLLSIGHVELYTAGSGTQDLEMRHVPNPERITSTLTSLLEERASA